MFSHAAEGVLSSSSSRPKGSLRSSLCSHFGGCPRSPPSGSVFDTGTVIAASVAGAAALCSDERGGGGGGGGYIHDLPTSTSPHAPEVFPTPCSSGSSVPHRRRSVDASRVAACHPGALAARALACFAVSCTVAGNPANSTHRSHGVAPCSATAIVPAHSHLAVVLLYPAMLTSVLSCGVLVCSTPLITRALL